MIDELIIRCGLYYCIHREEMTHVMQEYYNDLPIFTFEDELERCLNGETNHITMYALSRIIRATLQHWVVYHFQDFPEGVKKVEYYLPLIPPNLQTLERIDMLEIMGGTTSEFCLLIAKKPPRPMLAMLESMAKSSSMEVTVDETTSASAFPDKDLDVEYDTVQSDEDKIVTRPHEPCNILDNSTDHDRIPVDVRSKFQKLEGMHQVPPNVSPIAAPSLAPATVSPPKSHNGLVFVKTIDDKVKACLNGFCYIKHKEVKRQKNGTLRFHCEFNSQQGCRGYIWIKDGKAVLVKDDVHNHEANFARVHHLKVGLLFIFNPNHQKTF